MFRISENALLLPRMRGIVIIISIYAAVDVVTCYLHNETIRPDAASQQLPEFRQLHPKPIGVYTRVSGEPLDIRDVTTLNTDLFIHRNHIRFTSHHTKERIPERVEYAKGVGAFGYFEVTNDVSKYIKSNVFNDVGKRTPVLVRFSTGLQNLGGSDLAREIKGMSVKMYTKEGNLDFICFNLPIYVSKDPMLYHRYLHAFKRNPRTDMLDNTARWDFLSNYVDPLHTMLWLASDIGRPDGYRKMNGFAEHVYEIYNKNGKQSYVKFNFRTEDGIHNLTDARARAIGFENPDYYFADLYNAISEKNYPAWRLEMDILTKNDLLKVDYDPFDITRLWKRGTYKTVTVGRLVLNRRVDNHFKDIDHSSFSVDNLVPGIMGPFDHVFRTRKLSNPDGQNYRLGNNHDNIRVNAPLYKMIYNRDGASPLLNNMRDAPNYFPNSFNGPVPFVDEARRSCNLMVYHRNAVDLQPMSEFYNDIVESDSHRQRIANVLANTLRTVPWDVENKAIRILSLVDRDLGKRVRITLRVMRNENVAETRAQIAQCITDVNRNLFEKSIHKFRHYHY